MKYPFHRPPESAAELLRRVAGMRSQYAVDGRGMACDPQADKFDLCGLVERANRGKVRGEGNLHFAGDPHVLSEAKAVLCRKLGVPHLSLYQGRFPL